ncbi:MAG: DUF2079 domain-containing protein [Candidatus Levyibacteriota bacterium]|nr:MAG: DUF2079 domain-containing protein [Candidatus Levybacteria bacterium]
MKDKLLILFKLFLGWPITILSFFFIYRIFSEKTNTLSFSFSDINFILLATSIFCFFLYFSLRVILWQRLLSLKNHHAPFLATAFYWSSSEIKRFVPGNIWSSIARIHHFSKKEIGKKEIFFSIIEEAKIVVISSLIISIFSFSFVFSTLLPLFPTVIIAGFYLYRNPKNWVLLGYGILAFFCFGLGTYLSIASIISLSPYYITTFVSFFSFCYIVGYLSFVVPMGLGVRETVMTIGLSRFITESSAAIASVYTRVILIFAEVLFFGFSFFLYKTKDDYTKKIINSIQKHWHIIVLIIGIFFYILYFSSASIARYDNFYTGRFDLGNMDQTVWNTSRGRIFQLTDPDGTQIVSRLAYHADFILIFLAPFYKIWSDPRLLLVMQTAVLACGAILIYLIAAQIFSKKSFGLLFAFLYLFNPHIQHANLYDFHAVTLATTLILSAFYFLQKKKLVFFVLSSILAGLTKENVWLVISLLGGYLFIRANKNRERYLGATIFVVSMMLFYYLVSTAIPNARGTQHFAISYYADFGNSPSSIITNILFSPLKTILTILQPDRVIYIFQLFFSTGFLAFFSPLLLLFAAPDFAINLLSNNSQLRQIYYHYSALITPFIFISSIYGVKNIQTRFPKIARFIPFYLVAATIYAAYQLGPFPGSNNPNIAMFTTPLQDREIITSYLARIKKRYSVAATNNLGSHLSRRQLVYTIPMGIDRADILVFLLNDPFAQPSLAAQKKMVDDLKKNKHYILLFEKGDFVAFQKK